MNRKALLVFIVLLLLLLKSNLALSEEQQASDSSQFHGDERHNGFIASIGPTSPILAWKINQKCDGMIASNGRLLIADSSGVHILNETNGIKLKDVIGDNLRTRYPVIGAGNIFVSYHTSDWTGVFSIYDHYYYTVAVNLFSLSNKWTETEYMREESSEGGRTIFLPYNVFFLAYSKGKLFNAFSNRSSNDSVLRVRLASSGTILWKVKFKGHIIGTIPTIGEDVVVIGFLNNPMITALSTDNGSVLWNFTIDSPVSSPVAYSSGYFYFSSVNGVVYAVSKDGKELWHTKLESGVETTPAVAFGKVFVGADDGNLYVLNATSGKLVWKYSTKGPIIASPIVSINGIVYVGSTDGKIYALNAENGGIVWNDNTNASIEVTPVLDNGMLFVASSNGIIRAYYTANMPNNTLSTATTTGTKNVTTTQTVTNTQIATQSITTARVITSTVPTTATVVTYITTIIMERSWLSEEIIALAIILISAIIGLWLRRRWGKI